jgi:hypothetical protein
MIPKASAERVPLDVDVPLLKLRGDDPVVVTIAKAGFCA